MANDKQASAKDTQSDPSSIRANRTLIHVALIAAFTSIFVSIRCFLLTYFLVERVRTDLAAQTLALEGKKVNISSLAQQTSEKVAKQMRFV